jgi:acetylornithine deacetylase
MKEELIELLKKLIATPSFSKKENQTADLILHFLKSKNISCQRKGNNVWAKSKFWQPNQPTILLNSHHDTVKPVVGWQRNPYEPSIENGQLFGLGSNDAGASLVTLLGTFWHFQNIKLPFNLIFAATAEEEISGKNGIASILSELGEIALAIVGEPTQMQLAIAEKGLMVLDGIAKGKAGHAARNEGINAIDIALQDVVTIQNFQFEKTSNFLGNIKATVTQIQAGTQHNVVPDTNEQYSNKSVFELLQEAVQSELIPRSFRLNSSGISPQHPLVQRGIKLGLTCYGSPTLSDQALMPFPSVKIGPGDSARSHTADEFIRLTEIEQGLNIYKQLLLEWVI